MSSRIAQTHSQYSNLWNFCWYLQIPVWSFSFVISIAIAIVHWTKCLIVRNSPLWSSQPFCLPIDFHCSCAWSNFQFFRKPTNMTTPTWSPSCTDAYVTNSPWRQSCERCKIKLIECLEMKMTPFPSQSHRPSDPLIEEVRVHCTCLLMVVRRRMW